MAHKSPRNMSDCPEHLTGVRTRRMAAAEETPEQMRSGLDNDASNVPLDISVDRMEDTDASTILEMSDLHPTVSPYVPKCAPYPSTSSENTPRPLFQHRLLLWRVSARTMSLPLWILEQRPMPMTCHQKLDGVGAHSVTMVESVLAVWTPVVVIITGVSSVQCRTVCRGYVTGAMDLAATEDIDDILNCIRTD